MQGKDEKNAKIYKKRYPGTAESRDSGITEYRRKRREPEYDSGLWTKRKITGGQKSGRKNGQSDCPIKKERKKEKLRAITRSRKRSIICQKRSKMGQKKRGVGS